MTDSPSTEQCIFYAFNFVIVIFSVSQELIDYNKE